MDGKWRDKWMDVEKESKVGMERREESWLRKREEEDSKL